MLKSINKVFQTTETSILSIIIDYVPSSERPRPSTSYINKRLFKSPRVVYGSLIKLRKENYIKRLGKFRCFTYTLTLKGKEIYKRLTNLKEALENGLCD